MEIDPVTGNHIPLQGTDFVWSKPEEIDGSYGLDHEAELRDSHFSGDDKVKFKVEYKDLNDIKDDHKFTIYKDLYKIQIDNSKTNNTSSFAFNYPENENNKVYPPDNNWDKSYKFIKNGNSDIVKFKAKTEKVTATEFSDITSSIFSYSPIPKAKLEISHLNNASSIDTSVIIKACGENLIWTDVYPNRNYPILLYTLCESDDDRTNYCHDFHKSNPPWYNAADVRRNLEKNCVDTIMSPSFECLLPGNDGTFDLYRKANDWVSNSDSTYSARTEYMKIFAGSDLTCETEPLAKQVKIEDCSQVDVLLLEQNLNTFYSKLGINVMIIAQDSLLFNFDSRKEDDGMSAFELDDLYDSQIGSNSSATDTTIIWVTNTMIAKSAPTISTTEYLCGRAAKALGRNVLAISSIKMVERTLCHEIGHAKFGLIHPDHTTNYKLNDLKYPWGNDDYNIMNSGHIYDCCTVKKIENFKIRQYQWKIFQDPIFW